MRTERILQSHRPPKKWTSNWRKGADADALFEGFDRTISLSPKQLSGGVYVLMVVREDDGEMYRKHADDLVALAATLVGPGAAADVVSAAVARTIASPGWADVDNRYAYWVRAVQNEARSSYRSSMRRLAREERVARREPTSTFDHDVYPDVLQAVSDLAMRQRTVIYLAYWRDLPVSEIADLLEISQGAVRRHLARARTKLRRSLP